MRFLLPFFLLIHTFCSAQEQKAVNVTHDEFIVVDQDRFLVVRQEDGLRLIDNRGETLYHYTERLMADITSLDLTTSLRPMLFFAGIPAFQLLDNTLSPHTSSIDLQDIDMPDVTLMCAAVNNGYWVYDAVAFELRRMDERLNVQVESGGLNVVIGRSISPTSILARNNRLYLNDPGSGIHMFDFYAGYMGLLLAEKGITDFDVHNGTIVYALSEGKVFRASAIHQRAMLLIEPAAEPFYQAEKGHVSSVGIVGDRIFVGDGRQILSFPLKGTSIDSE